MNLEVFRLINNWAYINSALDNIIFKNWRKSEHY